MVMAVPRLSLGFVIDPADDSLLERRFQASEANLADFVKARGNTKPHLACLM
jgi:hypothetical protein